MIKMQKKIYQDLTRRCCICLETFLKLIVSKLDKRIVLLGQLQSQNSIVLFADFRFSLLQHSFTDEAHLHSKHNSVKIFAK